MADAIRRRTDSLADILCTEIGKPFASEARGEASLTPANYEIAAERAKALESPVVPVGNPRKRVMCFRRPHGVVGIITPWNFPAAIPGHYIPYALVMGNTVVWTPAPTAAATAVVLMEALAEAGLPKGVLNLVIGDGPVVGDSIVASSGTHAIALTGSSATGRAVSSRCGLKPRLMELGGNGPTIVFEDADPVATAKALASACFHSAGQICSSAERIFVAESIKGAFVETMVTETRRWVQGDPRDPKVNMGPQNNAAVVAKIEQHIRDACDRGARVLAGGKRPDLPGYYYQPTVLVDFTPDSLINREETFGPVAPIAAFSSESDLDPYLASCDLGLAASIFTNDISRAWKWTEKLRTGIVVVNDRSTYWELHIPTGGRSGTQSGLGRIGGRHTLEFMSDLQTVAFHVPD